MPKTRSVDDVFGDQEARRRTEAALRAAFNAPHKPQSEMKLGKSKAKPKRRKKKRAGQD